MSSRGVRSTRACLTRHLPAPGFFTLLPAFSSSGPVGLSHPTNAHGVCPPGPFPSVRGDRLIAGPFPSCRCRAPPRRRPVGSKGLLPNGDPFLPAGGLALQAVDALLGFQRPPQGSTRPAMGSASRPLPSCALGPKALHSRVFLRRGDAARDKADDDPLEVYRPPPAEAAGWAPRSTPSPCRPTQAGSRRVSRAPSGITTARRLPAGLCPSDGGLRERLYWPPRAGARGPELSTRRKVWNPGGLQDVRAPSETGCGDAAGDKSVECQLADLPAVPGFGGF